MNRRIMPTFSNQFQERFSRKFFLNDYFAELWLRRYDIWYASYKDYLFTLSETSEKVIKKSLELLQGI